MAPPTAPAPNAAALDRTPSRLSITEKLGDAVDIKEVSGNTTYLEAVQAAPIKPWSRTSIQLYFIFLVAYVAAMASGFDGSIYSSINAMEQFQSYFQTGELGARTGLIMMIYPAGVLCGGFVQGPFNDYFGRRRAMAASAFFLTIGAIILTAATNVNMLLGGRFILGLGVGTGTSASPTYVSEIAPPQWRGRAIGFYNTFFYTGSLLSTGVSYGASSLQGQVAFRFPLGLQLLPPLIILSGVWFIPESPRWLCMQGRHAEATPIIVKYHGGGDAEHPIVQLQIREFSTGIKEQMGWGAIFNYWQLFNTHNARWRMSMNLLMSVTSQLSGNSVLTYYMPQMYTVLGITSTQRRLLLTFANSLVSMTGAIVGSATNDLIGRRTKLWTGSIALACLFAAVTGFSSQFGAGTPFNAALSNGGVAMIFLFGCAYSFTYTPLSPTYSAEVLDTHTRAKGMGLKIVCNNICNMYNSLVTAIAMDAISWRYYFLFVALNVLYIFVWFFLGVETGGRTLEELDDVFEARWPPSAALKKTTVLRTEDGRVAELEA